MLRAVPVASLAGAEADRARAPLPSAAKVALADDSSGLHALLRSEAAAREAETLAELQFLITNETRKFTRARQVFLFRSGASLRIAAISDLPGVDNAAPLTAALEDAVRRLATRLDLAEAHELDIADIPDAGNTWLASYPFRKLLWLPLKSRKGPLAGGLLLARESEWTPPDRALAGRLSGAYGHALALELAEQRLLSRLVIGAGVRKKSLFAALALALAAMLLPVSMTTLAPFEVVPHEPFVVAAPIEGVIEAVLADPSAGVVEGQPLVRFADTLLRNRLEVAEREVLVAEAHLKQSTQLGFDQAEGRNAVGLAEAEHALRIAERDAARDLLARATIASPRAGVAVYSDIGALAGKPMALGERIMLIASPSEVEVAIDVPAGDALLLKPGARVKLFLDSDPVRPREATVAYADYQARARPGNTLAFRAVARFKTGHELPRLGVRGTAQLYGDTVPLAFYLFRRPVTTLRQWIGL